MNVSENPAQEPGAPTRAVFLSYASQDADAVRRVCVALREGGVEVWFDQNELRGGDSWDQKIRRQIRDCALFVPVISTQTQARSEGYFRREWKTAVERLGDMADGVPFLLPIVLDGIKDRDALVPEAFFNVQWTPIDPERIPSDFVAHVRALLGGPRSRGGAVKPASGAGPARVAVAKNGRTGFPAWASAALAMGGTAVGLCFAFFALPRVERAAPGKPPAALEPAPAPGAASASASALTPAAGAELPKLDVRRVVLARFENLTGDPALDGVARLVENEVLRGLGMVSRVRVLTAEAPGRSAARAAGRQENAGSVIVGSYLKQGDGLELNVEVLLVESGEVFGTLGPVAVPLGVRGPAFTELVDRLATGANNITAILESPFARMSAVTYNRPWPRWSLVQRQAAARTSKADDSAGLIKVYRELLQEDPMMLKTKLELARLLRDAERFDEAQATFAELQQERGRLSEAEILEVTYEESLMTGDTERALQAARGLLALRPASNNISLVLSCLWAVNRPKAADREMRAWWALTKNTVPENLRSSPEMGLLATEGLMLLRYGEYQKTLDVVEKLRALAPDAPPPVTNWLATRALAGIGDMEGLKKVFTEAALAPAATRIEPATLMWHTHAQMLHAGRDAEARTLFEMAEARLATLPDSTSIAMLSLRLQIAEGKRDYEAALALLDELEKQTPGSLHVVGFRMLLFEALGRSAEARALEEKVKGWELRNSKGFPFYWRARLAARRGEKVRAVELLQQAVAHGLWFADVQSGASDLGRFEPEFAGLRGYAPYAQLLKPRD